MAESYSFGELCQLLGKSPAYVRHLQRSLDLHIPKGDQGYSEAYLAFLQRGVALRTFNVPVVDIQEISIKECKILELLHFDSMSNSPTWYLDACMGEDGSDGRLLLTGHDLGFPLTSEAIQSNLDFRERQAELFAGRDMGEDIQRVLDLYLKLVRKVNLKVRSQRPVLEEALAWAELAFSRSYLCRPGRRAR